MKRAVVRISREVIEGLLQIPTGANITSFHVEPEFDGITIALAGDGLPHRCKVSGSLQRCKWICPIVRETSAGLVIDWDTP